MKIGMRRNDTRAVLQTHASKQRGTLKKNWHHYIPLKGKQAEM